MNLTGTEAYKKVRRLVESGWSEPEIAVRLSLKSTSTFQKWKEGHAPLAGTSSALRRMRVRNGCAK